MRERLVFLAVLLVSSLAMAAELHVPGQFGTIQEAVTAAANGDAVVVAPGFYYGSIDLLGKKITLRSSGGAAVTTLDGTRGTQSIITARRGESLETVIEGFTFRNGSATRISVCGYPTALFGGAVFMLNSGLTIRDSVFEDNGRPEGNRHMIRGGGAVFACNSDLAVTGTRFENNDGASGAAIAWFGNAAQKATVRNSTFRNNNAASGGGIFAVAEIAASLAVSESHFEGNDGAHGAAIWSYGINRTRATVERSTFRTNRAAHGAGVFAALEHSAALTMHGCQFDDHEATHGAGANITAFQNSHVVVSDCRFANGASAFGAGMVVSAGGNAIVDVLRCDFTGNEAGFGGGLFAHASGNVPELAGAQIRVTGCRFFDNVARECCDTGYYDTCFSDGRAVEGNGLYYGGGADVRTLTGGSITLTNCLFAGNNGTRGGGAHASSCAGGEIDFVNTTVIGNGANGLHFRFGTPRMTGLTGSGTIRVHNSIVRENTGHQIILDQFDPRARAIITFNNIEHILPGGFPGEGNIDVAPAFVDAAARDFRLAPGSPCIDAGNNDVLEEGIRTDLAGRIRFADDPSTRDRGAGGAPQVDLGAHEFQPDPGETRRRPSRR